VAWAGNLAYEADIGGSASFSLGPLQSGVPDRLRGHPSPPALALVANDNIDIDSLLGGATVATRERAPMADEQDAAAPKFEAIVSEHGPYLWRVLRRLGVRAADIEDVWQETFIVVHRKLEGFEGRSSVRTWLSAIAVRVASDYRSRAHRRHEQSTDDLPEDAGDGVTQHDELVDRERRALLDRLIAELKPEQRDVLVLYEFGELPMQEVAEALGCPLQTAYSRLHAARKSLEQAARREAARRGSP
jgi:RNA polymerase sigma-70 factor (ECF subfamily)